MKTLHQALAACAATAALLASAPLAAGIDVAKPPPAADFAKRAEYSSVKISPNGEYLAVDTWIGDQVALAVIALADRKVAGVLRFTQGEHVADFWWIGPERVAAAIAERHGPLDQPLPTGELFAMDADGTNKTYLFGYRGQGSTGTRIQTSGGAERASAWMIDPLPTEPFSVISVIPWTRSDAEQPTVYRLDERNGARRRLSVIDAYEPIRVLTDAQGAPVFATGYDRDSAPLALQLAADGTAQRIDYGKSQPHRLVGAGASADGQSVYLLSDEDGARSCLRELRAGADTIGKLSCDGTVDVTDVFFDFDTRRAVAASYDDGLPRWDVFAPEGEAAKYLQMVERSFPGQRVALTSWTADRNKVVVLASSDRNPGEYYLLDRTTGKGEFLLGVRSWIDPEQMRPMTPVKYATRDGATVHGYLTLPAAAEGVKPPLVLLPHGGPHGVRDYWEWDAWGQFLASRGYAVLQVNYRGSGGYGHAHETAGYRHWGTRMQDDLADAVRWAATQGYGADGRVCIVGASWGGYAALMSATRDPDLYRCAVTLAGISDLESHASDTDSALFRMGRNYLRDVLGSDAKELAAQSPVSHLERLKAPVLIAHGTADERVNFNQATRLRKELQRLDKPHEWLPFDGEQHGLHLVANSELFLTRLDQFLRKHLGAPAPTGPAEAVASPRAAAPAETPAETGTRPPEPGN